MITILKIIDNNKTVLAYLNNLESGVVRQVINGEYVISFTALIEELKTEFLHDENNLIEYDNDYFKVISLEEEHNSDNMLKVSVECEHISYDLIEQTKLAYTQTDRSAVYVMNDLLLNSGFNFIGTDVTTTASIDIQQETDIKSLLYQVAIIWGGELSYFQNDIELKQQLGSNRGADFRFGKNIQNIKRLIDRVENTVSYEVEIVQGTELQELGYFQLGDTIRVVDDMLKIEIDTRIIEIEKDIVTGLNSRVVLGQPIRDLSTGFSNVFNTVKIVENKVSKVIDVHGNLIAEKLSGALNTAITKVENSTGHVTFDDRGIITHNQPLEATSTKAILITSDGILIANAKNTDGTWRWRTAISADGISADEINTGTLTAININGVNITGSSITSDDANSEIKLDSGILSVKKKSSNQQFNVNYRAGLPTNILQSELEFYNEFKATNPNKPAENTISLNSANSHMGLEFGNGAVSLGNNWVNISMYGGTFDWIESYPAFADWESKGYNPPPTNAEGSKVIIDCATSAWELWHVDGYPPMVVYSSRMDFSIGIVEFYGNVSVDGNFTVDGTKNCRIKTEQYGNLDYSAYETAEIYLGDIGESEVINGECIINLDEKLLACVNTDLPYQVFLQAYGDGKVYVAERNKDNFVVKGDNIKFAWEVKAKRKNYENIRFGQPTERT
ncbi:MAG: prophage endopeptidase tail family protein [Sedimentibacter sp.]|uniref:prophage endopeptidase tail family protein n=1 Tax=Sedimentibacter sp. TaxID=1960295 RepID=UPI0031595D15